MLSNKNQTIKNLFQLTIQNLPSMAMIRGVMQQMKDGFLNSQPISFKQEKIFRQNQFR